MLLSIGQLSRRTGLAVRTIRFWSDIGVVPPVGRTNGGHRLYDAESVARLELVSTLRELGLGLDEVRGVFRREMTVPDVAAAHVAAIDARIRSLRLSRAVLRVLATRNPDTKELALMNKLARASAQERGQIIEDFIAEIFAGTNADEKLKQKLRLTTPQLPDDPSPEQVEAWVELAELVTDPGFRQRMRTMVEYHTQGGTRDANVPQSPLQQGFTLKMATLVGDARDQGVEPDSPQGVQVVDHLLDGADAARRSYVRQRLEAGRDSQADRYHELLAVINGERSYPSRAAEIDWLLAALDNYPEPEPRG